MTIRGQERDQGRSETVYEDDGESRPCGLYRTTEEIVGKLEAGSLVYYHNHGDPGPGVYPAESWRHNKAVFTKSGLFLPRDGWEETLEPLLPEGFYRVAEGFYCCEDRCKLFNQDDLVQLGYNRQAEPLLFSPRWSYDGLLFPRTGTIVERGRLALLRLLNVTEKFDQTDIVKYLH